MSKFDYEIFVLGWSAGVRSQIGKLYGKNSSIAEEYRYGGTCVIVDAFQKIDGF